MGFLDKYAFPNQAVYNLANKEGGGKCTGSADASAIKKIGECQSSNCGIKKPEKDEKLKTTTLHA